MKKTIIVLIAAVLCCGGFTLRAQEDVLAKLDKQGYCPITPGLTLKYANYDEDGEVSSYYILKVASVEGTMQEGTVVFHQYFLDEDGKAMFSGDNNLPMTIIVNSEGTFSKMSDAGKVMKIQDLISNGDASSVRPPLTIGTTIPDGHISLSVGKINVSLNTIDRKVTDCQTITVPAGTFCECYQIKEIQKTKTIFSKTENIETWYALGIGCIKQSAYDDKGRFTQSQELIEITLE